MKQPTTGGRWAYDPATDELIRVVDASAQTATTDEAVGQEPAQDETSAAGVASETDTPATGKKGK